jgi:outer membrane lipopolysaccharide assembly protein LptE/RlpB
MNKKIILSIVFTLLLGCGFTPMLKDFDLSNLNIQKINYSGKNELTYLVRTYINLQTEKNSKGLSIDISTSESTTVFSRNTSGITTEENLTITINLKITDSQNNTLYNDQFSDSKRITITNALSSDQEIKKIERNNLIRNLAQKIKFRLMIISKQKQ